MRRTLAVLALGALAPMVQAAAAGFIPARYCPDLGLLLVIALGLLWRNTGSGLVLAALLGYATDLLSGALLGQHVLLRVLAFAAARLASRQLNLHGGGSQAVFAAVVSLANALALGALTAFFAAGAGHATVVAVGDLWPQALINAAFAPAVIRATEWLIARLGDEGDVRRLLRLEPRELVGVISTDRGGGDRLGAGLDAALERRLPLLAAVILLAFAVFFVRLFQLQVVEADDLGEAARGNSVRSLRLEAPRGDVVDRRGRVLATTRPAFGVQVIPNDLSQRELTFAALSMLIDRSAEDLNGHVGERRGRERFQPVRLAGDLSYDQLARLESHLYALPGVVTDVRPRRDYVGGELAAHLLGSIGEIRREQLQKRAYRDYRQGEVIGQSGIETVYQADLRGRAGGRNLVVDVAGRVIEVLDEVTPVPGATVALTLDLDLQQAAEEAFLPEVLGERGKMGALVAIDPRNGDLLALVSKPSYDPNAFAGGIDSATWASLTGDEWRPLQNRAIAGQYPPGSTYKAIVAAAALEEGVVEPGELVFCPGHFKLGRRTYRCWKRGGHGAVDLRQALVQSCDVYFYQLGLKLGIDRLAYFARGFNLGRATGLALSHEMPGLVPTSTWKERRFGEVWMRGETVSASIGQGFNLITPLQLAVAYSAIATGGKVARPRLLLHTESRGGAVREGPAPEVRDEFPVSPEHLARVTDALEGVVAERGGTGGRARIAGVRVAGKTGTAQVVRLEHTEEMEDDEIPVRHRDHAWFVAFAPVEAPEITVAVLVEHGGHGASAAAPIAQRVLARYFERRAEEEEPPQEKVIAATVRPEREESRAAD